MKRKTNKKSTLTAKSDEIAIDGLSYLNRDLMTSILIVSLAINLFVLIGWVTLQVTTVYDAQVAAFLFVR